jgi:hypothetical protein
MAGHRLAVKAPRDCRIDIGATLRVAVPAGAVHLFDAGSGQRMSAINPGLAGTGAPRQG